MNLYAFAILDMSLRHYVFFVSICLCVCAYMCALVEGIPCLACHSSFFSDFALSFF